MTFKKLTVLTLSVGLSAGCGIDPAHWRDECDWAEPIRLSRSDALTDGTLAQIVAHNEIGERLCGWRPAHGN